MTEPHTTATAAAAGASGGYSLYSLAQAISNPLVAPLLVVIFAAAVGGYIAASRRKTPGTWPAVVVILRGVGAALVFSGLAAHLIGAAVNVPGLTVLDYLPLVAFLIGLQPEAVINWLRARLGLAAPVEKSP